MRIRLLFRFPESWRLLDLEYTNENEDCYSGFQKVGDYWIWNIQMRMKTAIQVSRMFETAGTGIYK
jgi:hypothetical protein